VDEKGPFSDELIEKMAIDLCNKLNVVCFFYSFKIWTQLLIFVILNCNRRGITLVPTGFGDSVWIR